MFIQKKHCDTTCIVHYIRELCLNYLPSHIYCVLVTYLILRLTVFFPRNLDWNRISQKVLLLQFSVSSKQQFRFFWLFSTFLLFIKFTNIWIFFVWLFLWHDIFILLLLSTIQYHQEEYLFNNIIVHICIYNVTIVFFPSSKLLLHKRKNTML